jgi:hypothetical protein
MSPRLRNRHTVDRREYSNAHLQQMLWGHDYFGHAFGDITDLPLADRAGWPSADVLDAMADCWELHHDDILALAAERVARRGEPQCPTFAELVFDCGMSPQDAMAERGRACRV